MICHIDPQPLVASKTQHSANCQSLGGWKGGADLELAGGKQRGSKLLLSTGRETVHHDIDNEEKRALYRLGIRITTACTMLSSIFVRVICHCTI